MAPTLSYDDTTPIAMRKALEAGLESVGEAGGQSLGEPTGWANLRGSFKIQGAPPSRVALLVNKDTEVCAPGGAQILDESVVVGSSSGIKNVLVFVSSKLPSDDPRWEHPDYAATKSSEMEFDQKNCIFLTHVAAFRATQRVKVMNSDPIGHNTNIDSKRGAAGRNFLVAANSYTYYEAGAASPAPFPVSCNIHPWMKAWMMVCDNPYFAVTNENGEFEIPNVPAGVELEFRVWQEASGNLENVIVNGQAETWSKGRFTLSLSPEENREMNVVVDSSAFQ
jgi:hypothetical protein